MYSKKAQVSIISFWKVFVAALLFIPFIKMYSQIKPDLIASLSNPFIIFILIIAPFAYWVGVAFLFVNTLRGNAV